MQGYCLSARCCNLPARMNSKGGHFITHQHSLQIGRQGLTKRCGRRHFKRHARQRRAAPLLAPKNLSLAVVHGAPEALWCLFTNHAHFASRVHKCSLQVHGSVTLKLRKQPVCSKLLKSALSLHPSQNPRQWA